MNWFRRLLAWGIGPVDEIADLRPGLGRLIKRAFPDGGLSLDVFGCQIHGMPVGDWRITVQRIDADAPNPSVPSPPSHPLSGE